MEKRLKGLYEFGEFRLDAAERLFSRSGETIPLAPKTFDLLLALVDQAGHLLERETLLKMVWPDTFVEDNNLADNISRLRKALGEGQNGQKFIETVPKRGYRFVAEVKRQGDEGADSVGREPAKPGEDRSADRYRSKVKLISVVVLVAVLFGAGAWLNGRVRKRVEIERLEIRGSFHLGNWNEDEIRKGIEYYNRMIALDPNSSPGYSGLASGWTLLSDLHVAPREAMPKAKAATARALQLDEKSPVAHLSLAVIKTQFDWDWAGAELEFRRAIQLDPEQNFSHQLYGWYLAALGRHDKAQAEMKRLLEIDSLDDFTLWGSGLTLYLGGQYEQSVELYRRAIAVEPRSYWPHMLLGWAYGEQNKFTDAISELQQSAHLFDNNPQVLASLGYVYARSGQGEAARRAIAELQETAKRRYVSPYDIATIYAGLDDKEQALAWLERAYEDRSGWLAWWLKVDPKFVTLRSNPRFRDLLRRIGNP